MNIVFATDIHLNFCKIPKIKAFAEKILENNPDVLILGGDISEAPGIVDHLNILKLFLGNVPVYFVCGNHDYYNGSIADVRTRLKGFYGPGNSQNVYWLPENGVVSIGGGVAIVGHDGWYDGGYPKYGDFFKSKLDMNDYYVIKEINEERYALGKAGVYSKIQELASQGAEHIKTYLPKAFENHDKVFYVTHVSPFAETSRGPNGNISDPDWMPSFCSKKSGDALMEVMKKMPANKQLVILCGHSHTSWMHKPALNITCHCGGAKYGQPDVAHVFNTVD